MKYVPVSAALLAIVVAIGGCQTYDEKIKKASGLYYAGQYAASQAEWENLKSK